MEKIKTKLGSAALFAVMAVVAFKTPLLACYENENIPPSTITSNTPSCALSGTSNPSCSGSWWEMRVPAYRFCSWAEAGVSLCEYFTEQVAVVITSRQCVYNAIQGDCLLGFTNIEVEITDLLRLLAVGEVCPEPEEDQEE